MNNYWVSFWLKETSASAFEYHGPWWISGYCSSNETPASSIEDVEFDLISICAAVKADNDDHAKDLINKCFDPGYQLHEWRFCESRPDGWSPGSDRFPMADWMKW